MYDFKVVDGVLVKCNGDLYQALITKEIREIGAKAFDGCKSLTRIKFVEDVIVINEESFANCLSLNEVVFPKDCKVDIKDKAFSNCPNLKEEFIEYIKSINSNAL